MTKNQTFNLDKLCRNFILFIDCEKLNRFFPVERKIRNVNIRIDCSIKKGQKRPLYLSMNNVPPSKMSIGLWRAVEKLYYQCSVLFEFLGAFKWSILHTENWHLFDN